MRSKCVLAAKAVLLISIIALAVPSSVGATPPVACSYWGTVLYNGANVPDGTIISVWSEDWGTQWTQTTTLTYEGESVYNVEVSGDDTDTTGAKEGPSVGESVNFRIGDNVATEFHHDADQDEWGEGGSRQIDLSATGATATPTNTPTQTLTPTASPTPSNTPTATETPEVTPTHTATPHPETRVFLQGVSPVPDYDGCKDTYIDDDDKNVGHDLQGLKIRTQGKKRSLIQFDLMINEPQGIPQGATVTSAVLEIKTAYQSYVLELDIQAYKLLKDWDEQEANWYYCEPGTIWTSPGADAATDRADTPTDTARVAEVNEWAQWDLTPVVQEWVNDPSSNHGVLLMGLRVVQTVEYSCYESEVGHDYLRPKLSVTYLSVPPTLTPTATATETLTPTPSPTVENSPTPSHTPTSSLTPTASLTPTSTHTPTPTFTPTTGSIFGTVYVDLNRDGSFTVGEGLAGAEVQLRTAANQLADTRTTGSPGTYVFADLQPGSWRIQVVFPGEYQAVWPNPPLVAVTVGAGTNRQVDFEGAELACDVYLPLVLKKNWHTWPW